MLRLLVLALCGVAVYGSGGGDGPDHPLKVHYDEDTPLTPDGHPMTHDEIECHHGISECHRDSARHVSGQIAPFFVPHQLRSECMHEGFTLCIENHHMNCSDWQELEIESIEMADEYICDHIDDYEDGDWEKLEEHYMELENEFCVDQFLHDAEKLTQEYMKLAAMDTPDDMDEKDELEHDIEEKQKECCGFWYAYVDCASESVERHADSKLGDWQYEVLSHYYEPQFEACECKVGKGMTVVFRNAMIIVAALFLFIIGLATCSGCANCCGEKLNKHKRRCRQCCYCCYDFEEDEVYFERQYEKKLEALYGLDNEGYDRKSFPA